MDASRIDIGSDWRRWDLHVHTPASDGFKGNWNQFETQLQKAQCDVIGINDYFSVAGYKIIKDKLDQGLLDIGHRRILPVVEFRMENQLQSRQEGTRGGTSFNFHIIFNDLIEVADIETLIKGSKSGGTIIGSDYDNKAKLLGKKIDFKELLNSLNGDSKFRDKFLLWLPYDEHGGIGDIDPVADAWIKEEYTKKAHIIGTSNENQIRFFHWRNANFTKAQFGAWLGRKKPCIKGSDSHEHTYPIGRLRDRYSRPTEKYCWIKADPTFEGLKQIIYEPEGRVFIGRNKPRHPINIINSMKFNIPETATIGEGDQFCFAGNKETYHLSPYFNCLIGGRGTGKSTILNFLGSRSGNTEGVNSWQKGDRLQLSFNPRDENYFDFDGVNDFEFLAQSEIEKFAKSKPKFTQAIYDRINILGGDTLDDYRQKTQSLQEKIHYIIGAIKDLRNLKNAKQRKQQNISTHKTRMAFCSSDEYREIVQKINAQSNQLKEIEKWQARKESLREGLVDLLPSENPESPIEEAQNHYRRAYLEATSAISQLISLLEETKFTQEIKKKEKLKSNLQNLRNDIEALIKDSGYTTREP